MKTILTIFSICAIWLTVPLQAATNGPGSGVVSNLTLERAIELALQGHPDLREAEAQLESSKARAATVGQMPNPEAVARIESAPIQGRTTREAEYVAGVSQRVPVGGRLNAARTVAKAETEGAEQLVKVRTMELRRKVHAAFAAALFSQEYIIIQSNATALSQSLVRVVEARVRAGDAVRSDQERLEVELLASQLEQRRASLVRDRALMALSQLIGAASNQIASLSGSLETALALPEFERLALDPAPYLELARSGLKSQEARLQLVRRELIPDFNFDLFYRRLQATHQDAFDLGVSVPLPVFGSRAKVREARADLSAAQARLERTEKELELKTKSERARLQSGLEAAKVLREQIIPRAERILETSRKRYQEGDLSLTDLIQQQRALAEARRTYLESMRETIEAGQGLITSISF